MDLPGVTQDQYDAMHTHFGPLAGQAPGFIAHIAGPTDEGWYMLEVWESKADLERFLNEKVYLSLPPDAPRPRMQEFDVYSRQTRDQLHA
jgi:hypothetical protein